MYFLRCILKKTYVRSFTIDLEIAVKYIKANIVPSLNRAKKRKEPPKISSSFTMCDGNCRHSVGEIQQHYWISYFFILS